MENGFLYSLVDETYSPAQRLRADNARLNRFVATELTPVPREGAWAVFRLNAAPEAGTR